MTDLLAEREFAGALAAAAVADIERAPVLKEAIASGAVGRRALHEMILRDVEAEAAGIPGVQLFPNIRKLFRERAALQERLRAAGLGVAPAPAPTDYSWIASGISALSSLVNGIVNYQTGKKLVELEKEKTAAFIRSQELIAKQAELDAAAARQTYSKEAQEQAKDVFGLPSVAGVPGWLVPVGAAAAVVGVLFLRG